MQSTTNRNVLLNSFQHRISERPSDPEITSQAKAVAVGFDFVSATPYVNSGRRNILIKTNTKERMWKIYT